MHFSNCRKRYIINPYGERLWSGHATQQEALIIQLEGIANEGILLSDQVELSY